jgi:acetoin utilization deacetylase AcuC-like enzyme
MNKTGYIYHPLYLEHDTGQHPENFGRLVAIENHLKDSEINAQLQRHEPRPATLDEIGLKKAPVVWTRTLRSALSLSTPPCSAPERD